MRLYRVSILDRRRSEWWIWRASLSKDWRCKEGSISQRRQSAHRCSSYSRRRRIRWIRLDIAVSSIFDALMSSSSRTASGFRRATVCTADAADGYWLAPLDQETKWLTAFDTPMGRYEWNCLPMGIQPAAGWFQCFMEDALAKCATCASSKSSTQKHWGKLRPHLPPTGPFSHYSIDFMFGFPKDGGGPMQYDGIMNVVDMFS